MVDVQLNAQSLTTTSATTAPAAGTSESWTVSALASGIPALYGWQTYALIDATVGATTAQQNEIIRVTACTGPGATTITVTRGADGTTPVAHSASATFNIIIVASWLQYPTQRQASPSDEGRALRTFRGAYLGGATSSPTDILIVGASFEEGYGATLVTNGWTQVFRDVLRSLAQPKGIAGGGSTPASNSTYQAGVGNYYGFSPYQMYPTGAYPDSPLISATGTFTPTTTFGLGLRGLAATANASTFTLEWFGTGCDIVYPTDPTFGAWNYSVDGGGTTAVNEAVTTSQGNRITVRNLARGRHTITITVTSVGTGNAVGWDGAVFYDGDETSGIRVWQGARSGYGAKDFVATTGQTGWVNSVQTWNMPDLVIINLGFNDWTTGRTSAQIKTDVQSVITLVKNRIAALGGIVPSFVLMSSFAATPSGSTNVEPWSNVVQKFYEIAAADDEVCVFDYQHWFGWATETSLTTRGGILAGDGIHPADGGAAIIGGALAEFVLDSSERMRDLVRYGSLPALPVNNASVAAQGAGFAADTYLTGSGCAIPNGRLKAGTIYRCKFQVTKTAAGVATPIVTVRIGTAGTTADTSRAVLTFAAQTAVADDGFLEVFVTFRSVGNGTLAVVQATGTLAHALSATGLSTAVTSIKTATSSGFDSTTANSIIGLSVNGGTSAAWTVSMVQAEIQNLA